jgi:hypothetical protein
VPERLEPLAPELAAAARALPLYIAGAGATSSFAERVGAAHLTADPVTEAERVTRQLLRRS